MKLNIENNKIIVYLNKILDVNDKYYLEDYLKKLLKKIKKRYNIILRGFCQTKIYLNKFYGTIIEINYDDIDYIFNDINIEINVFKNSILLYNIDFIYLNNNIKEYYKLNDKIYINVNKNILDIIEYGKIIYGENALKILNDCKKVKI